MEILCVYCGQRATTSDHVPPKSFYLLPLPPNIKTVPSCYKCNNSQSKDEAYTALMFGTATDCGINNEFGRKFWDQRGQKALKRNRSLNAAVFQTMHKIDVWSGKIIIGQTPCFRPNMGLILRVVSKIVRGLFYLENGRSLNYNAHIFVRPLSRIKPNDALSFIYKQFSLAPIREVGSGALCYKTLNAYDGEDDSIWFLKFQGDVVPETFHVKEQSNRNNHLYRSG